jgi:hypothetical protein
LASEALKATAAPAGTGSAAFHVFQKDRLQQLLHLWRPEL